MEQSIFFWKKKSGDDAGSGSPSAQRKAGAEKRGSERIVHALTLRGKRFPGNRAIARDISTTGLRIEGGGVSAKIESVPRLEKGEVFDTTLDLELINRTTTVSVEVMWVKLAYGKQEFEAGLRFVHITDEQKALVEQYIKVVKQSLERFL